MTMQLCNRGSSFSLSIATMIFHICVFRYTSSELNGSLDEIGSLSQANELTCIPEDLLVPFTHREI